ncbi:MAG: LOG family protein [Candidatus Shapirobacteria bacterium]|nr:LOG family protein [Candidatus Shapirobacteria bacterium]
MLNKTNKQIKIVAFFGDADAQKTDAHFIGAFETAKLLAENGYIIANGGGPGVMLAATLGAKAGSGQVQAVVIDPKKVPKNFEGESHENTDLVDKKYELQFYEERLNKIVEIADAFVIFKGGTGTLAEVGLVWSKAKFEFGHHEPLIFFGDFWREIISTLVWDLNLEKKEQEVYEIVDRPEKVLELLNKRKLIKKKSIYLKWLELFRA